MGARTDQAVLEEMRRQSTGQLAPELPDVMTVRVLVNDRPTAGMWVMVTLPMSRKNDFRSAHGPSDRKGYIRIERSAVLGQAQFDRDTFPTDFGALEADWTGYITVQTLNRDAIQLALDAVDTWGQVAWASPPQIRDSLVTAAAKLKPRDGAFLTLEQVDSTGEAEVFLFPTYG